MNTTALSVRTLIALRRQMIRVLEKRIAHLYQMIRKVKREIGELQDKCDHHFPDSKNSYKTCVECGHVHVDQRLRLEEIMSEDLEDGLDRHHSASNEMFRMYRAALPPKWIEREV